jgi:hypothetical protein
MTVEANHIASMRAGARRRIDPFADAPAQIMAALHEHRVLHD